MLEDFLHEISELVREENYEAVLLHFEEKITELRERDSSDLNMLLYEYAYILIDLNMYEDGVSILSILYNNEYKKDKIGAYLEDGFILPNREEFQSAYVQNSERLNSENRGSLCEYKSLPIDFIPINEDKYYIWDREDDVIAGIIDIGEEFIHRFKVENTPIECSDILMALRWNIFEEPERIFSYRSKTVYLIPDNIRKFNAFFKIPRFYERVYKFLLVFENMEICQKYFHTHTGIYLPRLFYAKNSSVMEQLKQLVKEEHGYRLTKEGRNENNILLSIGIPSYNRGHRAWQTVTYFLQTRFDSEIEVVVSDNCSTINTEGYEQISKLEDARVRYFRHEDRPGEHRNFDTVIQLAKGKYVCLLSDEDLINIDNLHHYIELCKRSDISMMIASGNIYYNRSNTEIYKAGDQAFYRVTGTLNYISGLIFRTDIYHKYKFHEWNDKLLYYSNFYLYAYAHNAWAMYYAMEGDVIHDSSLLIICQQQEDLYPEFSVSRDSPQSNLALYMTHPHRLLQHIGIIEVINQFSDHLSRVTMMQLYIKMTEKVFFLLFVVKERLSTPWEQICQCVKVFCIDRIQDLVITIEPAEYEVLVNKIEGIYGLYLKK